MPSVLTRRQFLLHLSYSMTINKEQGHVILEGWHLHGVPMLSHGQLYGPVFLGPIALMTFVYKLNNIHSLESIAAQQTLCTTRFSAETQWRIQDAPNAPPSQEIAYKIEIL